MGVLRGLAALAAVTVAFPGPTTAQKFSGDADSQRRGIDVVERGIEAMGGLDAMRRLETVRIDVRIDNITLGQAARPGGEPTASATPVIIKYDRDLHGNRRIFDIFQTDTSSTPVSRVVARPDDVFFVMFAANRVQAVDPVFAEQAVLRLLTFAPATLLDVLDRAGTVRWLGRVDGDGTAFDVVTYADALGQQIALFFDAGGRLAKTETIESHAQFGDHASEIVLDDFREIEGVMVPHRVTNLVAGRIAGVATYSNVVANGDFDETKLERPRDATEGPKVSATPPPAGLTMEEVGPGVFLIPNASANYNVMVSEQDDYVVILEPPISPAVSRAVIDLVRGAIPGKPIRYVALTHYHFDHSGGLRTYLDEGIPVVTTPGNVGFVESVARTPRTLDGGRGGPPVRPRIETVERKRVFGSGERRLELYEVGPNSHVDEILIGYFPALRLMFVADLYNYSGRVTAGHDFTLSLADAVEELGLEIERVVPVHGQPATGEDFRESVRLTRQGN